jgi:hypothetical protein
VVQKNRVGFSAVKNLEAIFVMVTGSIDELKSNGKKRTVTSIDNESCSCDSHFVASGI